MVKAARTRFDSNDTLKATALSLVQRLAKVTALSPELASELGSFVTSSEVFADRVAETYGHSRAMNRLGNALLSLDPHLTLKMVQSSLERDPLDAHQYGLWARALMALGRGAAAVKVLWQGVAIDPTRVENFTILANALSRLGRVAEAEALYRDTMRLFPDNAHCRTALAALLAGQGRVGEALDLYRNTVAAFVKDPVCRLELGRLLLRRGAGAVELAEVRRLLHELRQMRNSGANVLSRHLNRHLYGLSYQSARAEGAQQQQDTLEPDELPETLLMAADVREAQFRLGGALDNPALLLLSEIEREQLKRQAVDSLNRLMKTDPGHPLLLLIGRRYSGRVHGLLPVADEDIRLQAVHDPVTAIAARRFGLIQPRGYDSVRQQWPDHAHLADAAELLDLGPLVRAAAARLARLVVDWVKRDDKDRERIHPWDARLAGEFARLLTVRKLDITADNLLAMVETNPEGLDELLDLCLMAGVEMLPERSLLLAA